LLATPGLLLFSTFQTADIPLTYFFLASASLFVLAANENNRSLLFLSGLMAGLSAWTKNEGLPFLVLTVIFAGLIFGVRKAYTHILSLLAGTVFPLLIIFLFKILISVNNDLFTNNSLPEIIGKILDPARYLQVITYLTTELLHLGNWPFSILTLLIIYGWIVGIRKPNHMAEKASWLVPVSQLGTYLLIYVVTPHDLQWHMNYSMSRLLIHLFPLALFSFFLFVKTPEMVLNKGK
jgi:4-amino-4-deoxy-L-arabinose transferase-like glycosyltransferase